MCEKMPEQARFWEWLLLAPVTTAMRVILVGSRAEAKGYTIGRDDKVWRSGTCSENI